MQKQNSKSYGEGKQTSLRGKNIRSQRQNVPQRT